MSSADTTTTDAAEDEAPPRDDLREGLLEAVTAELGDAVVGSHIRPGDDLWIRVTREAWPTVADMSRRKLGLTFFDFLSAIDWMPSPYGRDMDSQEDLVVHGKEAKEPAPMTTGYAGGDTRFQVFARVFSLTQFHGITFTGHPNPINLYLPGAFEGYPLRKDFPLLARRVKPWPGIVDVEPMPGSGDDDEAGGDSE